MNLQRKTVSITDDDFGVLDALQLILDRAGYHTVTQSSARELLEAPPPYPDLILLDKQLQGIDGLDACRHLKSQPATAAIPIIIVSATPNLGRIAAEAGADGFIEKPFQRTELLRLIAQHLGLLLP